MTDAAASPFVMMDDDELYSFFSDFYKSVLGFRPRGSFWTREVVINWCKRESTPEAIARQAEIWAKEESEMEEYNMDLSREESLLDTESKYERMAENFGLM